jgi:hypothetical protein
LIAPMTTETVHGAFFQDYLDRRGEGLQSIILRVGDIESAADRATKAGSKILRRSGLGGDEPYFEEYAHFIELPLDPINDVYVTIAQIEKRLDISGAGTSSG